MRRGLQARGVSLSAAMATLAIGAATILLPASRAALIAPAQAQTEADKRKERERQKARPSKQQDAPSFKAPKPTPKVTAPPQSPGVTFQKQLPPSEKPALRKSLPSAKEFQKPPLEKPGTKAVRPFQSKPAPDLKKEGIKRPPPGSGQHGVSPPPKGLPPPVFKQQPAPIAKPPSGGPVRVAPKVEPVPPQPGPGIALKRFEDVKKYRLERVEAGGKRKVIEEPGKLFIVKEHGRIVVRQDESERFLRRPGAKLSRRPDGITETVYVRRDGVRVITVVDAHGRLLRRYRRDSDGRERNLIDNRRFYTGLGVGVAVGALAIIALNLPPPRVTIPAEKYIVDYEDASDDDLYEALDAPPIENLDRAYSLEEIRDTYELRARVRSIDIDAIHFDSGAWEVSPDQYHKLARIARAILRVLERNEEAVFMIAGFTDAVGSDEDNASLSDRRAIRGGGGPHRGIRRAGGEPGHARLWRAVSQDRHSGAGAAQQARQNPQRHRVDG